MNPPSDLGPVGLAAFDAALGQVDEFPEPDKFAAAVVRFARAVDLVEEVRAEWIAQGRPKLFEHSNKSLVPHPLLRLLQESEAQAARAGRALKLEPNAIGVGRGRRMGENLAPDRAVKQLGPVIEVNADEEDDAVA